MSKLRTFQKPVEVRVDSSRTTSDGGLLLLKKVDEKYGLTRRMAACLSDSRRGRILHTSQKMMTQRVLGIAMGWEDCNDFSALREDPLYPLTLASRLATQPTLSRFENSVSYKDLYRLSEGLVELFVDRFASKNPKRIVLDLDATVDPAHGQQQFEAFNGFYGCNCFLPLLVFGSCDEGPMEMLAAVLRPGNSSSGGRAAAILRRLGERLKEAFPQAQILVRADGGFAVPEFYIACESLGFEYLVGIASNEAFNRKAEALMSQARVKRDETGESARLFGSFEHIAQSWEKKMRTVIFKAEALARPKPGQQKKDNPRFVVTNLSGDSESLYSLYCMRGESENRIKEMKLDLFSGRTSCTRFQANAFRLMLHALAFTLLSLVREFLQGTHLGKATLGQIRLKLLKIAAIVEESTRRFLIRLPRGHPHSDLLQRLLNA